MQPGCWWMCQGMKGRHSWGAGSWLGAIKLLHHRGEDSCLAKAQRVGFFLSSPPVTCQWGNKEKKAKAGKKKSLKKKRKPPSQLARRFQLHFSGLRAPGTSLRAPDSHEGRVGGIATGCLHLSSRHAACCQNRAAAGIRSPIPAAAECRAARCAGCCSSPRRCELPPLPICGWVPGGCGVPWCSPACSGCRQSRCIWRGSGGCTRGGQGRSSAASPGATISPCPSRSGTCKRCCT